MKPEPDIRVLEPADATEYKRLRVEAADDPSFGTTPALELAWSTPLLAQALGQDDGGFILGAFDSVDRDRLIGMVGYGRGMIEGTGSLFGLYVSPAHRRAGVGGQLCEALVARQPGDTIRLEVLRSNTGAISLYRTLSFDIQQTNEETVVMVRRP